MLLANPETSFPNLEKLLRSEDSSQQDEPIPTPLHNNLSKVFIKKPKNRPPFLTSSNRKPIFLPPSTERQPKRSESLALPADVAQSSILSVFKVEKEGLEPVKQETLRLDAKENPRKSSYKSIHKSASEILSTNKRVVTEKEPYELKGIYYRNYVGKERQALETDNEDVGHNPFVRFERLALQRSLNLLENQDKLKYLRKGNKYEDDDYAIYQMGKYKRPQDAVLANINSQRKAILPLERKIYRKTYFQVYEDIKRRMPNDKAKHMLSPRWERKYFAKTFIKLPKLTPLRSLKSQELNPNPDTQVTKQVSIETNETLAEESPLKVKQRPQGKLRRTESEDALSMYIKMFADLEKKTVDYKLQQKPLAIRGSKSNLNEVEEYPKKKYKYTIESRRTKNESGLHFHEDRIKREKVISITVLKENFPDIFQNREVYGNRILQCLGINEDLSDSIEWEKFLQFTKIVVFNDCPLEETVNFVIQFFKGDNDNCTISYFLTVLKNLLEERFSDSKDVDELLHYIVENYENYGIIRPDSEYIDFEMFQKIYLEKKMNIIHLQDVIVNKK